MGWVMERLLDADGAEVETGLHKLWSAIDGEENVGDDAAGGHVDAVADWLHHRNLLGSVSALKVSADATCTLVVYLSAGVSWQDPSAIEVAEVVRQYCCTPAVKAGWANVACSDIIGTL